MGIGCMILLVIACFLPGIEDIKYTMLGDTWGFEYYKNLTFLRHNLGFKSFVMLAWLGILTGGILHCVNNREEKGVGLILLITAVLGVVLLIRTYDYSNNPSKLVLGNSDIVYSNFGRNMKKKNFSERIDSLNKSGQIRLGSKGKTTLLLHSKDTDKSFCGIKARKIVYNKTFPLGDGFWFMLVVVIVQLLIAFKLWNIDSQIEAIESVNKK